MEKIKNIPIIKSTDIKPTKPKPVEPPKKVEPTLPESRWTRTAEGQYSRGPLMPGGH